ncbi:MAG TPA: D-alanyl-D-alanine carboxypeptidase, partial [Eudoraea sp.]|nr:D-alanyl-D-alanine carboxypeptidase [Eudoraea sp.]
YGNVLTIFKAEGLSVTPSYFKDSVIPVSYPHYRHPNANTFFYDPLQKDTLEIPYITSNDLTQTLMEKASGLHISQVRKLPELERKTIYGIRSDSLYKRMMQESDNFLAEQLLILSSSVLSDTLSGDRARGYVLDSLLGNLMQPPRWVDGSGLSRYNLFTPESLVHVLGKMLEEFPKARLFQLFPAGGVSGTLAEWYPGNPKPYLYAKTGTLGNNHCLSGYLITKSGKTLIFSFMNNHFRQPVSEVKNAMQHSFEWIRDNY